MDKKIKFRFTHINTCKPIATTKEPLDDYKFLVAFIKGLKFAPLFNLQSVDEVGANPVMLSLYNLYKTQGFDFVKETVLKSVEGRDLQYLLEVLEVFFCKRRGSLLTKKAIESIRTTGVAFLLGVKHPTTFCKIEVGDDTYLGKYEFRGTTQVLKPAKPSLELSLTFKDLVYYMYGNNEQFEDRMLSKDELFVLFDLVTDRRPESFNKKIGRLKSMADALKDFAGPEHRTFRLGIMNAYGLVTKQVKTESIHLLTQPVPTH